MERYGLEPFAEDILQHQQVLVAFRDGTKWSQDIHAPDLKRGASLDAWSVDVFLFGSFLILNLTGVALLNHSMDLRH